MRWGLETSAFGTFQRMECQLRLYQDRVLLSVEVSEPHRHSKQSGPMGVCRLPGALRAGLVLDQGTHHSSMSNLAATCLEFGHGVEGAL